MLIPIQGGDFSLARGLFHSKTSEFPGVARSTLTQTTQIGPQEPECTMDRTALVRKRSSASVDGESGAGRKEPRGVPEEGHAENTLSREDIHWIIDSLW